MCGIAGIYSPGIKINEEKIREMIHLIRHRGPDDEGYYISEGIGLGHCRLSIIDLSDAGHQPMSNADGTVWIVYNGEIYNYKELFLELKSRKYSFKSTSDTEVILHAYEEWGADCVKRFNGMWAFAVWDNKKKLLFLSRDRLGVKPLYYHWDGKQLVFASEIKAVLSHPSVSKSLDIDYINNFISTGMLDHDERTFFAKIKSLSQAHSLLIKYDNNKIKKNKYWKLIIPSSNEKRDFNVACDEFRELMLDSIRLRLNADVEIGSCLSGGLDSSSIVSIATKLFDKKLKTFSVVYNEIGYSEKKYVDIITSDCKSDSYMLTPMPNDLVDSLSKIIWFNDGPSADPTIFSQWSVMKLAHLKRIKVLLDGQGGDELFGGYHKYFPDYLNTLFKLGLKNNFDYLSYYFDYFKSVYPDQRPFKNMIYCLASLKIPYNEVKNDLNYALMSDIISTRLPWLLHYEDRCSMAFSIESRTPFLDYRLVEFAMKLPFYFKIDMLETKIILRKALKELVSTEILERRDKKGFPTPAAQWFRFPLKSFLEYIFDSDSFKSREVLKKYDATQKLSEHCEKGIDHTNILWRCLTTELWFRQFIDNKKGTLIIESEHS